MLEKIQQIKEQKRYKGKVYGIIRRTDEKAGLFSYYITILGAINKCLEKNLIPIVDMQNVKNLYLENEEIGRKNAWEFYFQQPQGYSLNDIDMDKAVIIDAASDVLENARPNVRMEFMTNPHAIAYWRKLAQQYIPFNDQVRAILQKEYDYVFSPEIKWGGIIGVLCRGTDYTNLRPNGHPIQPTPEQIIEKINLFQKYVECPYVFLATEDENIKAIFQKEYGKNLLFTENERFSYTDTKYLSEMVENIKINKQEYGLHYLTSIWLLSNCKYLFAGRTSGTIGALLMGKEYQYTYLWNEGYYGDKYTSLNH